MKKIIGVVLVLLSIVFFTLITLRIWGVSIVNWPTILRSGITFILLGALVIVLALVYFLFLKTNKRKENYN